MELFGEFHEIFTFGALGEWQSLPLLIQPQATSCLFFQMDCVPTRGGNQASLKSPDLDLEEVLITSCDKSWEQMSSDLPIPS